MIFRVQLLPHGGSLSYLWFTCWNWERNREILLYRRSFPGSRNSSSITYVLNAMLHLLLWISQSRCLTTRETAIKSEACKSLSRAIKWNRHLWNVHSLWQELLKIYNHQGLEESMLIHCQNLASKILVSPGTGNHHNDTPHAALCLHIRSFSWVGNISVFCTYFAHSYFFHKHQFSETRSLTDLHSI